MVQIGEGLPQGRVLAPDLREDPEETDSLVAQLFEKCREFIEIAWSYFKRCVEIISTQTGFIFFRALEFVFPTLGLRLEVIALRVSNAWKAVSEESEVNDVVQANAELSHRIRDLERQLRDSVWQQVEIEQLRQANAFLEGRDAERGEQLGHMGDEAQAVVHQRDLYAEQNFDLREQNQALQEALHAQREAARQLAHQIEVFRANPLEREEQQDQENQREPLREQLRQLQLLLQQQGQEGKRQVDVNFVELLALYRGQLASSLDRLKQVKEGLSPTSTTAIAMSSVQRVLRGIQTNLNLLPDLVGFDFQGQFPGELHPAMQVDGE